VLSEPLGEKGRYVRSFDGTRIYTEEVGQGPTFVLVHGWFCNTDMWHYQKKLLADSFRIVCYDQRGHRRSDCPHDEAFTLEALAMDLKAVLDAYANDEPVVLVGHSMGGMSIIEYLQLFPGELGKRIRGVALVDTTHVPMSQTMMGGDALASIQKPVVEPLFGWVMEHPGLADGIKKLFVRTAPFLLATRYLGYGSGASMTQMEYIQEMARKTSMKGACQAGLGLLLTEEPKSLEALRESGIPVLIWVGEKDKLTRPVVSVAMKEELPEAELRIVPDTGHPSYMEEYGQFNDALIEMAAKAFSGSKRKVV
jgi:pimeloyl-ACP methyl ester carboxylesterase